jgi:hypothetical protein
MNEISNIHINIKMNSITETDLSMNDTAGRKLLSKKKSQNTEKLEKLPEIQE